MAGSDAAWTIDQLSELVADALSSDYPGQANGRVRQVPDVRTIRWYTSIGLLDRPGAMRGRTALYGRRHLAQLVAVKRLQADGHTLADVQQRLIGADDATLERIARLGELVGGVDRPVAPSGPSAAVLAAPAVPAISTDGAPVPESIAESIPSRDRFWSSRADQPPAPTPTPTPTQNPAPVDPAPALIHGIRLTQDVTLLLEGAGSTPDSEELAAITEAAKPLLDLLRALGLSASPVCAPPDRPDDNALQPTTTTGRQARGAVRRGTRK